MRPSRLLVGAGGAFLLPFTCLLTHSIAYTALSDASLQTFTIPDDVFDIHNQETGLLAPILIPRVAGTEGNRKVQKWFLDFFAQQLPAWNVTTHTTTSKTPATGDRDVPFTNIIATRNPPWAAKRGFEQVSYLTLAAHFDSKRTPEGFIGATDSAAPCAMILHAARTLDAALEARWAAAQAEEGGVDEFEGPQGLQIILLDGEEAMVSWTHEDSLYGARALAADWEAASYGELGNMASFPNRLGAISLFVLLDLLGAAQPMATVPSYFRTTHWAYKAMAGVEQRLRGLKLWESASDKAFLSEANKTESGTGGRWLGGMIEDDHLPFMARGVEILHLIANPFPKVWHTMMDDGEHLDIPSVKDWANLVTAFTAEWMDLEGYLGQPKPKPRQEHSRRKREEEAEEEKRSTDKSEL